MARGPPDVGAIGEATRVEHLHPSAVDCRAAVGKALQARAVVRLRLVVGGQQALHAAQDTLRPVGAGRRRALREPLERCVRGLGVVTPHGSLDAHRLDQPRDRQRAVDLDLAAVLERRRVATPSQLEHGERVVRVIEIHAGAPLPRVA